MKAYKILVAYAAGQVTQLVIHGMALSFNMWNNRQIPFCLAAGFIVFFAILSGVWISGEKDQKPQHEKTYLDYAKIPSKANIDEDLDAELKDETAPLTLQKVKK